MSAILLTGPPLEPLTIDEAKAFLRVANDDDDAVIAALIAAARNHVEALTRRGLLLQTWRFVLDAWPADGRVRPRIGPLRSLVAVRLYDHAGNAATIDVQSFVIDVSSDTIAAPRWTLPAPERASAGIEIDVQIGFGANPADVPDVLRHAIRTLVAHWYENRGLAAIGQSIAMLPGSVNAMISSYRVLSL